MSCPFRILPKIPLFPEPIMPQPNHMSTPHRSPFKTSIDADNFIGRSELNVFLTVEGHYSHFVNFSGSGLLGLLVVLLNARSCLVIRSVLQLRQNLSGILCSDRKSRDPSPGWEFRVGVRPKSTEKLRFRVSGFDIWSDFGQICCFFGCFLLSSREKIRAWALAFVWVSSISAGSRMSLRNTWNLGLSFGYQSLGFILRSEWRQLSFSPLRFDSLKGSVTLSASGILGFSGMIPLGGHHYLKIH